MNKIFCTVITFIIICTVLTGCSTGGEKLPQTTPLVENPLPLGPSAVDEEDKTDSSLSEDPPAEDSDTANEEKSSPFLDINLPAVGSGTQDEENKSDSEKENNDNLVDLTVLSSTMVYAEVYNMMSYPEDYLGKTIKMIGLYYPGYFEQTDKTYHFAVIADAAACCSQGIEFIWNGEHKYPDDYPEEGSIIEITGIFKSYEESGETYYYVATDEINKK